MTTADRTAADRTAADRAASAPPVRSHSAERRWVGQSIRRVEDPKFLRGRGGYIADRITPGGVAKLEEARPAWERAQARMQALLPEGARRGLMEILPEVARLTAGG